MVKEYPARTDEPHIVIIGAGFGGLRAARSLGGKPVQVTLVDQNNYHLFQPLLYQIASAMLAPDDIAYPVRATLHRYDNIRFHLGRVEYIDLNEKVVVTDNHRLAYDMLVLATGGQTNFFGITSVEENGFGLKDLEDATGIRNHILTQFEKAVYEPDPDVRRELLTFVVVGGGPTGVECAGAISELVRLVLRKDYPSLNIDEVQVILLEMIDRLLAAFPEPLGKVTADVLRRKHVDVRFQSAVASYDGNLIQLKDGRLIPAKTLIWASGVRAASLLDSLGVEQDRMGRIKVTPTLQVPDYPNVFVIGDAAHCLGEDGKPLPMMAPVAMQQADTLAKNVMHQVKGESLENFRYREPGTMATIGRNHAVAVIKGWKFRGFIAWLMWLGVHIIQLVGFRNRIAVLLNWGWSYVFYENAVRLIAPSDLFNPMEHGGGNERGEAQHVTRV